MKKFSFRGVAWDSLFLTVVNILTTFSSIAQTKLLALGLSLEDYGTYSQTNIVLSIGVSMTMLGLRDAVTYFYNNDQKGKFIRTHALNTIFFLELAAGAVLAVSVILGRYEIARYFSNDALAAVLPIVAAMPVLSNLLYFYQLLYISNGKSMVIAVRNLVLCAIKIGTIYIAVFVLENIVWIFCILLIVDSIQLYVLKSYFDKTAFVIRPHAFSRALIAPILSYSLPMGMFNITTMFAREVDKLVVGRLETTESLAIYVNCSKILPFDIVVVSFAAVLIPYIMRYVSQNERTKASTLFSGYLKIGYYSVWILGIAVLITSEQVLSFLYTDDYLSGNTVFKIYTIDSMLKFASMHLILTAGGKSRSIMRYSLVTTILNVILNIILYYMVGITGPALATLFTTMIYTFLILNASVKLIDVSWNVIFDWKDLFTFAAVIAVTGMVFFYVNDCLLKSEINKYIAMMVSAGGFCVVALLLNLRRISNVLKMINGLRM